MFVAVITLSERKFNKGNKDGKNEALFFLVLLDEIQDTFLTW